LSTRANIIDGIAVIGCGFIWFDFRATVMLLNVAVFLYRQAFFSS